MVSLEIPCKCKGRCSHSTSASSLENKSRPCRTPLTKRGILCLSWWRLIRLIMVIISQYMEISNLKLMLSSIFCFSSILNKKRKKQFLAKKSTGSAWAGVTNAGGQLEWGWMEPGPPAAPWVLFFSSGWDTAHKQIGLVKSWPFFLFFWSHTQWYLMHISVVAVGLTLRGHFWKNTEDHM